MESSARLNIAIVEGESQGTGLLLGARLVLTAAHLLGDKPVRVAAPRGLGPRICNVLWHGDGERCDAALLLAESDLVGDGPEAVRWGEPGDMSPWSGCEALGFPRVQRQENRPDTEQFVGTLKPGSALLRGRYVIDGEHSAPRPVADGSPWQGMSGAAVMLHGHVIGVAVQDPGGWGHGRLEVVPARLLLEDEAFVDLVERHTGVHPTLESLVRSATGSSMHDATDSVNVAIAGTIDWEEVSAASAAHFGVHRVREVSGFPRMVNCLPRDFDNELQSHLAEAAGNGGLVLLTGPSAAGKTRSAFEAIRRVCPDWLVCRPEPATDLSGLTTACRTGARHLVWLDDLEGHLHSAGLTAGLLAELQRRGVVVVATLRSHLYDDLLQLDSAAVSLGGPAYGSRAAGRLLRQARHVQVPRTWSEAERVEAGRSKDPRVLQALEAGEGYGLAEYLAAGPQLLERWKAGGDRHPRGAALVAAAVDLARAGLAGPLPAGAIEELHGACLQRAGGAALRPEPIKEAWEWATRVSLGITSLLVPAESGGWRPFDYLVTGATQRQETSGKLDESVWRKALDLAEGQGRSLVAWAALTAERSDIAEEALLPLAAAGETAAMVNLAAVLIESGERSVGERWLREAARHGDGTAMLHLGALLVAADDSRQGKEWLEKAVESGRTQALRLLGDLASQDGEDEAAAELWERGAEQGDDECAVKYGNLLRQRYMVLDDRGTWLQKVADRGLSAAALSFAGWLAYREQKEAAAYYLIQARKSALAAAEEGDPDAMITLGTVLAWEGDAANAESWFRKARQRTPLLMPDWRIVRAEADRGGLQAVAVSRSTEEQLAEGQLADVMEGLWPLDCQYCGLSLGAGVPALRVFEQPWGATASLYHLGMCRYPEWTDNDGTRRDSRVGIFKIIGSSEPRLTWTASAAHAPHIMLDDKSPLILLVNAGVESVELTQSEDGQWRMAPSAIHQRQGMMPAGHALNHVPGAATVLRRQLTVKLGLEEWSSEVSRDMKRLCKRQGGVLLVITSGLAPVEPSEAVLNMALSAPDVVAGWVPLAQGRRKWSPRRRGQS